ncbi:YdeI/OmpD-associated family protein [Luteibaculum oceani]|uniref:Bacteriocin-protection protein n=1 Tax=Luteibaculum oceani TaxID=1294296 RepID=A0A5C6URY5_9FLAO|nr:YdeI/OmpD-associated family protein [Luteibaculum oceani]TXC76072.1 hypothetical protein FRX97_11200 [Luteibaculum oceani]
MDKETLNKKACLYFSKGEELRKWFELNHDRKEGFFLIIYHKGSNEKSVYYDEARDIALCFGWVDAVPKKRDHQSYYLYMAPRNPKSNWSMVNKKRVDELYRKNLIHPSGYKLIELAKKTGTWIALDDVYNLVIHKDLKIALDNTPSAKQHFQNFSSSKKRQILEWIYTAKRSETRAKRIESAVSQAEKGLIANDWKRRK